jgi:plexin A
MCSVFTMYIEFQNPSQLSPHGANFCPRFMHPVETILLPNNVPKDIVLQVENLPQPQAGHKGFLCIVTIEGAKMMVPARVESGRFIVCDKTTVSNILV